MVYYTMYLDSVNHQKLRCIVKNLSWRKSDFSERGLALKGLIVDKHPNLRFTLSEKLKKLKLCRWLYFDTRYCYKCIIPFYII